jgi:hypothetical protein
VCSVIPMQGLVNVAPPRSPAGPCTPPSSAASLLAAAAAAVLCARRHGDRTPKQKMKVKVCQEALLQLFERHKDSKGKQAKLKSPNQLQVGRAQGLARALQRWCKPSCVMQAVAACGRGSVLHCVMRRSRLRTEATAAAAAGGMVSADWRVLCEVLGMSSMHTDGAMHPAHMAWRQHERRCKYQGHGPASLLTYLCWYFLYSPKV